MREAANEKDHFFGLWKFGNRIFCAFSIFQHFEEGLEEAESSQSVMRRSKSRTAALTVKAFSGKGSPQLGQTLSPTLSMRQVVSCESSG